MFYTADELVRMIAQRLGVIGDGQSVEPEDASKIRLVLPGITADLDERGIAAFPDLDLVPAAAALHLVAITASALSDEFGLPQDEIVTLASRAQAAEGKLRVIRSLPYSGAAPRVSYF